jgi:hypothetical protein
MELIKFAINAIPQNATVNQQIWIYKLGDTNLTLA